MSLATADQLSLPRDPAAPMEAATKQYVDAHAGSSISLSLPFYLANGSASNVPLTADQKLPFLLADGSASNIALTT